MCAQPNTIDSEDKDTGEIIAGAWKSETNGQTAFLSLTKKTQNSTIEIKCAREEFAEYIVSAQGSVPLQNNY